MAIVNLATLLSFCEVDIGFFTIDASHDTLVLSYDGGTGTNIDVSDNTYNGVDLATELQTKASSGLDAAGLTVSYDTTGKKFTITAASTGETIAYISTGSDAGLTFGFNQDHAAAYEIESDLAAGDPSAILESIRDSVEDWVENHCHRKFEATLYVKERHDGDKQDVIYFDQNPVIAVNLDNLVWDASAGTVIRDDGGSFITDGFTTGVKVLVQNSDSNSGLLTASTVATTGLTFIDTITADTDDDNVILSHFQNLWINDTEIEEDDYAVFSDHIYYNPTFTEGYGNVRLSYYAGYSSTSMPEDLKLAIKIIVKSIYQRRTEELFGTTEYWVGDIKVKCEDSSVPKEALDILDRYRRILI